MAAACGEFSLTISVAGKRVVSGWCRQPLTHSFSVVLPPHSVSRRKWRWHRSAICLGLVGATLFSSLCVLRLPRPFAGNSARVTWRVLVCDVDVSTKVADEKRGHGKRVPDTWRRMHVVLAYVKPLYRGARPSWTRRFSWMGIAWIDDGMNSGFLWEYKRIGGKELDRDEEVCGRNLSANYWLNVQWDEVIPDRWFL